MQRRFWNWKDDDKTIDLIASHHSINPTGVYNGFDFSPTADMNLNLVHSVSGFKRTLPDFSQSNWLGSIVTKQGTVVVEDETIIIPIAVNSDSNPRIDTIYVTHRYREITGGEPAVYVYAKGTPSATPSAPAVPNSNTDVIIGYLYLPGSTTQLNAANVTFTKEKKPNFAWTANEYSAQNYITNGDTPHEAIGYLDAFLKILYDKYETNTLSTTITANGTEAGKYAKIALVTLNNVTDFYSAIIALTGGNALDSNSLPFYGIFEIQVRQTASFGSNPVVKMRAIAGNIQATNNIVAKIVSNSGPSEIEFHVYGGGVSGNNYAVRVLCENKAEDTEIIYYKDQTWSTVTGTTRTTIAKKIFKKLVSTGWPSGPLVIGTPYNLSVLTTPNDGIKRSFECVVEQLENFGTHTGWVFQATLNAKYTSGGSPVSESFQYGGVYWDANAASDFNVYRTGAFNFIDVDPGTTIYIEIITDSDSVSGGVRIRNIKEIDTDEYDIS